MDNMRKRICVLQKALNELLQKDANTNMQEQNIYSLSVLLDHEIAQYYKNQMQQAS